MTDPVPPGEKVGMEADFLGPRTTAIRQQQIRDREPGEKVERWTIYRKTRPDGTPALHVEGPDTDGTVEVIPADLAAREREGRLAAEADARASDPFENARHWRDRFYSAEARNRALVEALERIAVEPHDQSCGYDTCPSCIAIAALNREEG